MRPVSRQTNLKMICALTNQWGKMCGEGFFDEKFLVKHDNAAAGPSYNLPAPTAMTCGMEWEIHPISFKSKLN